MYVKYYIGRFYLVNKKYTFLIYVKTNFGLPWVKNHLKNESNLRQSNTSGPSALIINATMFHLRPTTDKLIFWYNLNFSYHVIH